MPTTTGSGISATTTGRLTGQGPLGAVDEGAGDQPNVMTVWRVIGDKSGRDRLVETVVGHQARLVTAQRRAHAGANLVPVLVAELMERRVNTISPDADAVELTSVFERGEVALVVDQDRKVQGILTKMDLIEYLTKVPSV